MIKNLIQHPIARLMRLDKPIGTWLLLWPTLWALWIASNGLPSTKLLLIFIIGVFITRSAGCLINDLWDKDIDGRVKRTATRPLANQQISTRTALLLLSSLAAVALGLVLLLNPLCLYIALALIVLIVLYPACKRFFPIPQLVLGLIFNGVLMAFAAVQNHLPWQSWLLFVVANLWTLGYDTAYAMVDRDDDITLGLKSSAITFGHYDRLAIAICQAGVLIGLIVLASLQQWRWPIYLALLIVSALFGYQQWLMRLRQREACFQAFKNNFWVGLVLWLGLAFTL